MNIDMKSILPYLVIACSIAMSWGMISQRLEAVESKVETIVQIQIDLAVIKQKLVSIEELLQDK
jgi:hypothetical protein|tara:strand:+ start:24 stop:215 length:192 start_codon:yes stop_codon:yes gene_type:complete